MQYNYERISNWKKNTSKGIFNKNLQSFQFSHGFHVVSSHFYRNHAILSPETRCESRLLDAANPLPGADATKQEALAWRFLSELVIIQGLVLIFLYIITILLIIIMYIYIYILQIYYVYLYIHIHIYIDSFRGFESTKDEGDQGLFFHWQFDSGVPS